MKYNWNKINESFFKSVLNESDSNIESEYQRLLISVTDEVMSYLDEDGTLNIFDHYDKFSEELATFITLMTVKQNNFEVYEWGTESDFSDDYIDIRLLYKCVQEIDSSEIEKILSTSMIKDDIDVYVVIYYMYKMGNVIPYDSGDYWTPPEGGYIDNSKFCFSDVDNFSLVDDEDMYKNEESCNLIQQLLDIKKIDKDKYLSSICSDIDEYRYEHYEPYDPRDDRDYWEDR